MASKPPIDIRADRLETSKAENRAVYSGNVEAIQGRQRLRTPQLTIYTAEKEPAADKRGLASAGGDVGKIKRMEAEGPAFFNDDTQNARGDHGTYVAADDTITLTGNVVLLQGTNVTLADKVVIDQTTHHATLYSGKTMPRIRSVFREDNSSKAPPSVELPPSN
jgi:lipopolysaccharide export system protein LptA